MSYSISPVVCVFDKSSVTSTSNSCSCLVLYEGLRVSLRQVSDVWLVFDWDVTRRSVPAKGPAFWRPETGIFHEGWCAVGGAVRVIFVSLSVGVYNSRAVLLLFKSRTFAQGLVLLSWTNISCWLWMCARVCACYHTSHHLWDIPQCNVFDSILACKSFLPYWTENAK